ncbi:MAG: hypothetical protein PVG39_02045 [Desulfobacteraceae bacterium]
MPAKCHRWNFEADDENVYACQNLHEKGEKCDYEKLSPYEIVKIIDEMRAEIIKIEAKLKLITS